jgi:OOP family OmpA-OmpF porin
MVAKITANRQRIRAHVHYTVRCLAVASSGMVAAGPFAPANAPGAKRPIPITGVTMRTATTLSACFASALLTVLPPAAAQSGWYAGLTLGASNIVDDPDVVPVVGATASRIVSDERDPGVRVLAGYRFNRWFGVEGGYAYLGEFQFTNNVSAPTSGALNADVRVLGLTLDAVGMLPLGYGLTALGKVGVFGSEVRTTRTVSGNVTPGPEATTNASTDEANLKYGVGLQYDLGKVAAVRAEWERYTDLGNAGTGQFDIDLYSVGLMFRF